MPRLLPATLAIALLLGALAQAEDGRPAPPLADTIQAYEKIVQGQPDSPQLKRALYRLGQAYQSIGSHREAATRYETLAQRFAGEIDKPDETDPGERIDIPGALERAALLRRGLGETEKYIEDVRLFIRRYGGRKEFFERAAGLFFDLGQHDEERQDVAKLKQHYAEYLKTWADKGGTDRRVIAEVKLGELAWRSSCPVPGVSGSCIDIKRERASRALVVQLNYSMRNRGFGIRCGPKFRLEPCAPGTKALITVYARNPALVSEAMAHFQTALKLHERVAALSSQPGGSPLPKDRLNLLTQSIARARIAQGDMLFEALLQMKPPSGLAFNPKDKPATARVQRRLQDWIRLKQRKLDGAKEKYEQVITLNLPYFAIAAEARISQLYLAFANGLYRAELPAPPPPPPMYAVSGCEQNEWKQISRDAFCDHMEDAAEPLEALAKEHLLACLRKSTELGEANEWSRLCEEELYQLNPREYPLPSESYFEPSNSLRTLDVAPLLLPGTEK